MLHDEPFEALKKTLYVVATPIGNRRDITLRALDVLRGVDVIAAEDTRVSAPLLRDYGVAARLVSLHRHNEKVRSDELLSLLGQEKSVAVVSDAGTPGLCDPGALLVERARNAGFAVVAIPGPSALTAAIAVAALASPQFVFCGFLPATSHARQSALEALASLPFALVFYETPHRVLAAVADMATLLGADRQIVIARELTKLFESVHRISLGEAKAWLTADANRRRGEFVLLVDAPTLAADSDSAADERVLRILLDDLPLAQAARLAAAITGRPRKRLYERALALRDT